MKNFSKYFEKCLKIFKKVFENFTKNFIFFNLGLIRGILKMYYLRQQF